MHKKCSENVRGKDHSENLGIEGRIIRIRMDLGEIGWEDVDWIHVTDDSDQWRVLENAVLNLRVT
jgi:hypothetical protein